MEGDLAENVSRILDRRNVELVIMGERTNNTIGDLVFGTDTNKVINRVTRPVLIVPSTWPVKEIKKVAFAADFDRRGIRAVQYLVELKSLLRFWLQMVNIYVPHSETAAGNHDERVFMERLSATQGCDGLPYCVVKGENVIQNLADFCAETEVDILAVLHHQNSWIMRLVQQSTSKKMLSNPKQPVLVIPSDMV